MSNLEGWKEAEASSENSEVSEYTDREETL